MKQLLTAILFACLIMASNVNAEEAPPPGQIGVSPSMLELSIGTKPVNESLRLFNLKKTSTKVNVEVYNWTLDENNEVKLLPPSEQSLDQWMLINPMSFVLEPGKSQVVRLSIRPPVKPAPGEHRALIYFTEERLDNATAEGEEAPVEVLFKLGVGVYANANPTTKSASLKTISLDNNGKALKTSISNNGNVHSRLKGTYSIWKKTSFPGIKNVDKYMTEDASAAPEGLVASGQLNQTPILPGSTRTIVTQLPGLPAPGSYIVAVSGSLNDSKIERTYPVSR